MSQHATRITAADHAVTVTSNTATVTDWARRYFGQWWNAAQPDMVNPPLVVADVDAASVGEYTREVTAHLHQETTYANARLLHQCDQGTITACQPDEGLAYRVQPGLIHIAGRDEVPVCLAAARIAREVVRGQLLRAGWSILHASAAVRDGQAVLTIGDKGAGKTTTALLLARAGWQLLANDRVFVRPDGDHVRVLPWPSAAAIGLGLLDALDLYDSVRERTQRGELLHPTQDQRVTDALAAGRRKPLWNQAGKELKPQFFPDQLAGWLGLTLADEAIAARLVYPRITPATAPAELGDDRPLTEADFFTGTTEDRYPDVFRLLPGEHASIRNVLAALASLPSHTITLSHEVKSNTDFLTRIL
ncbi:hypothetical protein AB0I84_32840 [Streptomyces spectabilis]|uniref:hypothetical protein n=1 Tax=Streptomyces spectabilis TaxID=68270 RepID=UPI0033F602D1